MAAPWKMKGAPSAAAPAATPELTPDSFMATQAASKQGALTPDSFMAQQRSTQPSVWQVLTQPTEKTDAEFMGYRGAAGVAGATIKGLDDVARGTQGAIKGIWSDLSSGHVPIIHSAREAIADTIRSLPQIPGAVQDINASPDPLTHYADAAQDTASQGAGQALTALGTVGLGKVATDVAPYVSPVGKALVKGYVKKLIPEEVGTAYKAVKTAKANAPAPWRMKPQAAALSELPVPGARPAAQTGEALAGIPSPATFPGAPFPEVPPLEVLQAQPLSRGGVPTPPAPSAALGQIPAPWRMRPQAAALGDLPATDAVPAAQTGEALGRIPAPWRMKPQSAALAEVPTPASQPTAQTGEALGQIPTAPWRMKPQAAALGDTPQSRATISQQLDETLRTAVGNTAVKPGIPMRYQFKTASPAEGGVPMGIPEGHTAVESSSAVKSFKYDPDAQELHIAPTKGYTYVYGDVSPEQAAQFQNAGSKGTAWGAIRNSNPLVAKIHENGTRTAITPTSTATSEDLTRVLQQSVEKAKWKMKAAQ
jgi:hypothetical protein